MRAQEFINEEIVDEYSSTAYGVVDALKKKGYKHLGSGVDQTAFMEPGTGHVLKIFGTDQTDQFSADHKMFFRWAKFCEKHQDNPFLPRFYGHESFLWPNIRDPKIKNRYLMIRTEPLKDSGWIGKILANMVSEFELNDGTTVKWVIRDLQETNPGHYDKLVKQMGKEGIAKFLKTAKKLHQIGERAGYAWDLHYGNIMRRADGTPVINDPWVV
jgi:hypothetical protein